VRVLTLRPPTYARAVLARFGGPMRDIAKMSSVDVVHFIMGGLGLLDSPYAKNVMGSLSCSVAAFT
jgi:hypothetical protein